MTVIARYSIIGGVVLILSVAATAQDWTLTGNAGTDPTRSFLGTLDEQPLVIKTNGHETMRLVPCGALTLPGPCGAVLIGTDRGSAKLDVSYDDGVGLRVESDRAGIGAILQLETRGVGEWRFQVGSDMANPVWGVQPGKLILAGSGSVTPFTVTPGGRIGIGTFDPVSTLQVVGTFSVQGNGRGPGAVGAGIQLNAASVRSWELLATGEASTQGGGKLNIRNLGSASDAFTITDLNDVGIGTTSPRSKLDVAGTATTSALDVKGMATVATLQITGGSDISEPFEFAGSEVVSPGTVLSISRIRPGQLEIARRAYDRAVAGVVSGANGLQPGIQMTQGHATAGQPVGVALTGRVYCFADASYGPIAPGDLLTTSDTPGHAMKVTDYARSEGAKIGKAMTGLEEGRGLVLVLVSVE